MRSLLCVAVLSVLISGCPGFMNCNNTGDFYATGRSVVGAAQTTLSYADAAFEVWISKQTDLQKIADMREKYNQLKMTVLDGLKLALDGIELAAQAVTSFNIIALMTSAEKAYVDLRKFLADLFDSSGTKAFIKDLNVVNRVPITLVRYH